ncbi:MAG: hypothetical protein JWQ74_127 [Marmoricola sp.]|nr:hypothetical protein [Marmoricola sp.]
MVAKLGLAAALVALGLTAAGCAEVDRRDEVTTFCASWDAYSDVEDSGTVGELGPALKAYAGRLPKAALPRVKATAQKLSTSWDKLYQEYTGSGGDPSVRLQVKGDIPAAIGGMHAEWLDGLDKSSIKELYRYSNRTCQPITPATPTNS